MAVRTVNELVSELFAEIQEAQGYAFCSDGEVFDTTEKFFDRIRGRLAWNEKATRIMQDFLRRYGEE